VDAKIVAMAVGPHSGPGSLYDGKGWQISEEPVTEYARRLRQSIATAAAGGTERAEQRQFNADLGKSD